MDENKEVTSSQPKYPSNRGRGTPQIIRMNGGTPPSSSPSPRLRRHENTITSTSHAQHQTRLICNSLWGQRLTFHPYVSGDSPIPFSTLWPDKKMLVETYTDQDAELNRRPYDLCKLLLSTNSWKSLDALLDEQAISIDCEFGAGCGTLLHLACALGLSEVILSLVRRSQSNTKVWAVKDTEGHVPEELCPKMDLRKLIPSRTFFKNNRGIQVQTPKPENKKEIFELATRPDSFYCLINMLNTYPFDLNNERNNDGDLLIHVAIKGGLPQLPLLFALVNYYKGDINLKDASGTTPLSLAIRLGEETLSEVLICVFGVDINEGSTAHLLTPLHVAVNHSRPRIVNMLLRRGADALKEDKDGCIPSFLARKQGAFECRQIISQHLKERTEKFCQDTISGTLKIHQLYPTDLCAVSSTACTLVMLAAMHNQEDTLRQLIKKGDCPLDFRQMKSCDLVDSLSDSMETNWCETDKDKDHSLKTAVHFAAEKGNLGCLQALLDANAHPALVDGNGWLPIYYAVDRGHIECVKALLAYPNHLGLTRLKPALDISRGNQFTEITTVLEHGYERRQRELIHPLLFEVAQSGDEDLLFHVLQNGDDVNPLNESHDWPLLLAAGFGYHNLVYQLHQFGGHVAKRHRISRSTPLHVAARGGHTKMVRYLLQFCRRFDGVLEATPLPTGVMEDEDAQFIDINGKNTAGATPLELAASQGHTEVVKLLLEKGASTTLPDSNGRLLTCSAFAGTQFLLETHRKERRRSIIESLRSHSILKSFRQCWQGPSDFNLYAGNGDNMLMVAAQYAEPEVLQFLLDQAAAVKPSILFSSEQEPLLLSSLSLSRSEESSDTSLPTMHVRNKSDSHITHSLSMVPKPYDPDVNEPERHTALPWTRNPRPQTRAERLTASGGHGSAPEKPLRPYRGGRGNSISGGRVLTSTTTSSAVSSSEEDEHHHHVNRSHADKGAGIGIGMNGARVKELSDNEGVEPSEPFIGLIRFCNHRDGQTALHRASRAGLHRNVSILLRRDLELANMQDHEGNTALHLACCKASKPTVQALLSVKCVMTTIRNKKNELAEHNCMKSAIKKLVCKVRQSRAGIEFGLPDPPTFNHDTNPPYGSSITMETTNGLIPGMHGPAPLHGQLPGIPEMVTPNSSMMSDISLADLNTRLQQMKSEIKTVPSLEPISN